MFSVSSQIRKWAGSSTAINFTCTKINAVGGKLAISLTNEQTSSLKSGRYVYDIIITDSITQQKSKVIEGMALVREGVTR